MNKSVLRIAYYQISEISRNGCGKFKCKNCVLNKMCDRFPDHSQALATQVLIEIKSQGK